MNFIKKLFFNEKKYQEYLDIVKKDGYFLYYVPEKYITEELCKIAVHENGFTLTFVPEKYKTEEILFMAQQTKLWYDDTPTVLTECIFRIYRTMGK